ncbi:MAG: peptidoglycan DD-metalloendopeptidase family protein [Deltaproteobacteria bacterium]|nr:peptidoglycan DD-metalloendopeptidase family protein [Deltaproteobacteria bacterium]
MIDKVNPYKPFAPNLHQTALKQGNDIKEAASEFESFFIYYMLKSMRETVMKSGLFGDDKTEEVYRAMLDEELSKIIAKSGGIGLREFIVNGVKGHENSHPHLNPLPEGEETILLPHLQGDGMGGDGVFSYQTDKNFQAPVRGAVSSGYGFRKDPIAGGRRFHYGIDIPAHEGTPVHPSSEGTVIFSGEKQGYGNIVEIRHDNGYVTSYAHNQKNLVKQGDRVKTSDIIAMVGRTGRATGPHLHFEVRIEGFAVNPENILNFG